MPELWQPIKGYEGLYEVSNQGRVRSLDRTIWDSCRKHHRKLKDKHLTAGKTSNGYLSVALCKDGKQRSHLIHILLAQAFIANSSEGNLVLHWNDIKTDNRVENLRWGTYSDNQQDAMRTGRRPCLAKR